MKLTVVAAKLTRDTETFSKMDPFVELKLREQTLRTKWTSWTRTSFRTSGSAQPSSKCLRSARMEASMNGSKCSLRGKLSAKFT